MLAIRIDLLAERYHATPWGRAANEGDVEWPPSPWRLGRALVDAWYRLPLDARPTEAALDAALAGIASPPSFRLPRASVGHTRHYMPQADHGPKTETRLVLDAFVRTAREPIVIAWADEPPPGVRETLAVLLAALGYLGRAESRCLTGLADQAPAEGSFASAVPLADAPTAQDGEVVRLLCLSEGARSATLSISTAQLQRQRTQQPPDGRFVDYLLSRDALDPPRRRRRGRAQRAAPRTETVRLALESPILPPMIEAMRVSELARRALLSHADRHGAEVVARLRGRHGTQGVLEGHRHCHYLATDDDADGRIDHLTLWCPEGFGVEELALIDRVSPLSSWWVERPIHLVPVDLHAGTRAAGPAASARTWMSHTPFLPVRHAKRRPGGVKDGYMEQVRVELRRRGFPEPVEIRPLRPDWRHWGAFRRERDGAEPRGAALGYTLVFDSEVRGPISLGRNSHFGMGLFVPQR